MATDRPKVCILGTGRSGSGYIAAVLSEAGVACGHEAWWNPLGDRAEGLAADSSWCALPEVLDDPMVTCFLQVRHPLKVVASLVASPDWGPYLGPRAALGFASQGDPVRAAMALYVGWNRVCLSRSLSWWRVEDLTGYELRGVAGRLGIGLPMEAGEAAISVTPTNFNAHGGDLTLTWADLPAGPERAALWTCAERFGYDPEEP